MGIVGVPSVALACTDWRDGGGHHLYGAEKNTSGDWWNDATRDRAGHVDRGLGWSGTEHSEHSSAASQTPTASASTPNSTTPKPKPKPKPTTPSSTPKASASASATPASPSTSNAAAPASGTSARIVQLVNAERSKIGCSPVTLNAVLAKAAQAHSEDMAAHQNMSHTGSDGSSPGDRITRAGYNWSTYGENVAYGYATPEQVMAGWMSSPG
ncbi:CAP domain-containing protein, partial [Streptomyces sp. NPDC002920]